MWLPFFLQNANFALTLLAALVFLGISWLYFDSWLIKKSNSVIISVIGFLLIAISFFCQAVYLDLPLLSASGYLLVAISLIFDPLQAKPSQSHLLFPFTSALVISTPFFSLLVTLLYLRRAILGLERHVLPVSIGFAFISVANFLSLASLWNTSTKFSVYQLTAEFGPIWIIEHLALLVGTLILGRWLFSYLLKRLFSQLFMILTLITLSLFLATTVSFTSLLLSNLQTQSLAQVSMNTQVLSFVLSSKRQELISTAQLLSANPDIASLSAQNARGPLSRLIGPYLQSKNLSSIYITNSQGQVIARGENPSHVGDFPSDPIIKHALLGQTLASISITSGPLYPTISLTAASPISSASGSGVIAISSLIDNAFVDGLKANTGLDASVYGHTILSATTLSSDTNRPLGVTEFRTYITDPVLTSGKSWSGPVDLLGIPYFANYQPLLDSDNVPVGMLFVGQPQSEIYQTASQSIHFTFLITTILLILSILPTFLISRYISRQS